jgi:drug/metabolite transporter (DMT)-like permease
LQARRSHERRIAARVRHVSAKPRDFHSHGLRVPPVAVATAERSGSCMHSLWMIGASLAFAGMGVCIKLGADRGIPLGHIIFYRCLISLIVLFVYLRWRGWQIATPNWKAHLSRSASGLAATISLFGAISLLPLATAITLQYTSPLFVTLALILVHRERPRAVNVLALASGFFGVALLLRPTIDASQWLGAALALASAVAMAVSVLNMRILGGLREPSWRTVFYFSLFATLAVTPWYLATDPFATIDAFGISLLLGVGVLGTAGQLMVTLAFQRGQTLVSANLGYTQVVFASLLGILIWNEVLSLTSWVAILVIIASGAVATTLMRANSARPPT